ncbi:HNH endonuclease [Proteus mirabilis]|uniref:HNH endonuclease n=1 Tax=Proteus mirabilis TaxID=584 RepID=UPI0034D4D7CF
MINLTPYSDSSISFLRSIINSKNRGDYKDRISNLFNSLNTYYQNYDTSFDNNTLNLIQQSLIFSDLEKKDLLKLYNYSSKPFANFKNQLLKLPNGRDMDTCQYCTLNSVNTLDHIIPKENYPEYAVHPKNLFPACSQCNSKKSNKWLDNNNNFEFINLYSHDLPNLQYLFANINLIGNTFNVNFELRNENNINEDIFMLIERHYINLDLLNRFKSKSNEKIAQFENIIISNIESFDILLSSSLNSALVAVNKSRLIFGANHWEQILYLGLINGSAFRTYCNNKGYQ